MDDSWLTLILLGLAACWMPLVFGVEIYALGDNDGVKKVSSLLGGVTSFRLLVSVGVLLLVAGVLTTLSQGLSDIGQFLGSLTSQLGADVSSGQHLFVDLLLIAAGVVLVIQAIRRLRSGSDADEKSQTGDDKALTVGATGMLGLGLLMTATNAEQWILMSAAVNQVLRMEVEPWRQLFAFLLFLALSSLLILLPLILYLVRPQQAGVYLVRVDGWINGSMRYVAAGILALIGLYLVWKGGIGAVHFLSGWLGGRDSGLGEHGFAPQPPIPVFRIPTPIFTTFFFFRRRNTMSSDSTSSAVYNILAFVFDGQKTAGEQMKDVKSSGALEGYAIDAQAVVEQDAKGKVHIHEPGKGGVGGTVGAVTGGLLGLIGGPVGVLAWAVGGAVVGGVAGHYMGRPISKGDLQEIGDALKPDSSAMLMLLEDTQSEGVVNSMSGYNANVVTLTVGDELSGQIAQYTEADASDAAGDVVATEGGVAADADGDVVAGGAAAAAAGDDGSSDDASSGDSSSADKS